MNMSEYLKKKRYLLYLTVIAIIVILVSSIYTFTKKNSESSNITQQNLKVTYNITNDYLYPMDKEDGASKANNSSISIKNNTNKTIKYKFIFKEEDSSLDISKVYFNIDNQTYKLSDFKDNIIMTNSIKGHDEYSITFKAWVGLDLITSSDLDKVLNLKYEIIEE